MTMAKKDAAKLIQKTDDVLPMDGIGDALSTTVSFPRASRESAIPSADDDSYERHDDHEFFIPVHGFVSFTEDERTIINHPAFQRLGEISQLGHAYLVYRGAKHTRFEHVLGTVHVAQQMIDAVAVNYRRKMRKSRGNVAKDVASWSLDEPFSRCEEAFIRLAALLHDIGHLSCGHTLEDELNLLDKHDRHQRFKFVLENTDWPDWPNEPQGTCESLKQIIDRSYSPLLKIAGVANHETAAAEIVTAIVCKDHDMGKAATKPLRISVCRDIVGNTICADLLDYLHRDWWHIGKYKHYDKRLFQYMEVRRHGTKGSKFVISLGDSERLRTDAVTSIIDLLECRYQLAEAVIFHRTKCAAAAMFERAVQEIYEKSALGSDKERIEQWKREMVARMLHLDDRGALNYFLQTAKQLGATPAVRLLKALKARTIYHQAYTFRMGEDPIVGAELQELYTNDKKSGRDDMENFRGNRLKFVRSLEQAFGLEEGTVAIYCPATKMNAKIAEVNLHVDNRIAPFFRWAKKDNTLGAGHLAAQTDRFERLWRAHVCIERKTWDSFSEEKRIAFKKFAKVALGATTENETAAAKQIAKDVIELPDTPFPGHIYSEAARDVLHAFPSGTPSILNYIKVSGAAG